MLSALLKSQTQPYHDQAESSPAMQAVIAPDLTREAYRDHLVRLLAFYGPTEAALADVDGLADVLPDLPERLVKTAWLRADLDRLGGAGEAPSAHAPAWSVAEALGVLYVIEGSTLGGRSIARELERSVGVTPEAGGQFYASYRGDRGPRWKTFKAALNAHGEAHPEAADDTVRAAADTFDTLRIWMAMPLPAGASAGASASQERPGRRPGGEGRGRREATAGP
ncbi:MAG: biliverdin-producing heme oxygenase [Bacteroidota bacterium]